MSDAPAPVAAVPEHGILETEQTGPQVSSVSSISLNELARPTSVSYATYREMTHDATIAFVRALSIAPIQAGAWSVEAAEGFEDHPAVKEIEDQFLELRPTIYDNALAYGNIDYGWIGFEKVFEYRDGLIRLVKLKPLLHDVTKILVFQDTGKFMGLRNTSPITGRDTDLFVEKSLLISFRVEGTYWYGSPLLENVRRPYCEWNDANEGAARYDRKIAGSHFVVHFPKGPKVPYNGVDMYPDEIARQLLAILESSGSISVPASVESAVASLGGSATGWKIEILEDSGGRQPTFIDRLKYLDVLKARGLMMPERTIFEGEHGTKAEAGEHMDSALTAMAQTDIVVTRHVNWHAVNQILRMNWGSRLENKIWLSPAPLQDEALAYLRDLYMQIITNPVGFAQEAEKINTKAIKERLQVPVNEEEDNAALNQPGMSREQIESLRQQQNEGEETTTGNKTA